MVAELPWSCCGGLLLETPAAEEEDSPTPRSRCWLKCAAEDDIVSACRCSCSCCPICGLVSSSSSLESAVASSPLVVTSSATTASAELDPRSSPGAGCPPRTHADVVYCGETAPEITCWKVSTPLHSPRPSGDLASVMRSLQWPITMSPQGPQTMVDNKETINWICSHNWAWNVRSTMRVNSVTDGRGSTCGRGHG